MGVKLTARETAMMAKIMTLTHLNYARNSTPFSHHEYEHNLYGWFSSMDEADRLTLWSILQRNPGKRMFNAENGEGLT